MSATTFDKAQVLAEACVEVGLGKATA